MRRARTPAILGLAALLLAGLAGPGALRAQSLSFGPPHLLEGGFELPFGLAIADTANELLVADTGNHSFKTVPLADLAGSHSFSEHGFVADRSDPAALVGPQGLASDGDTHLYVVNTFRDRVFHYERTAAGYVLGTAFASSNPTSVDGVDIDLPRDIVVDAGGAVYLLDSGNNRILKADGPTDTSWEVFHTGADWANPYGLGIDAAGALYVADTGNHRIVKIDGPTVSTIGGWGEGNGQFRYPRDVAVDRHGRIFVADTFNHRIQVLAADGRHLRSLGHAPAFGTINKVAVDGDDRVFAVDSDANRVIAFLGASVPAPFDPYFRNFVGDDGAEPSDAAYQVMSPDILVRHAADIDLELAATDGLESFAFQQPKYGETNFVYVALHNRGTQPATDNFIKLFWYDPSGPAEFPEDWSEAGFYRAWTSATSNQPTSVLPVASVPPGGTVVVGPLLWRPPAPEEATAGDGVFRLAARVSNPHDFPPSTGGATMARDSNNVTERRVAVLRGPFAQGIQNTLVVRVHFPDIAQQTDEALVVGRVDQLDGWVDEVSWGQASVAPVYRGPIIANEPSSHYAAADNTVLVELAEDVLGKLLSGEPGLLAGSTPGEEITRILLVTNDLADTTGSATSAPWPYDLGGGMRYLTVSVHGGETELPAYAHGMSRQFGMQDLFAHENVSFPRPYADGWDTMARPHQGAHPLVWSKELAHWVSFSDAEVLFVPRPDPGVTWDNGGEPVHLFEQASQAGEGPIAIAFGLTHGITSFVDETAFYYVEARSNSDPDAPADSLLPTSGVLMYYANRLIPTGQGPVILRDHVPGGDLTDAAIPVGGSEAPAGTGLSVTVQTGTGGADYDVAVSYTPPVTDYDVFMERGDPPWQSPDIWVDNQADGYDEEEGRAPEDRGNMGIAGEENRVYARVRNQGPATAHDVEVAFLFSEPYHTVGGEGSFDEFRAVFLDSVAGGSSDTAFVEWTPQPGVNPHTCARVELRRLFNDTNPANDWAQRNLEIDHSVHGSPYTPVTFPFSFRNEEEKPQLIYFRVDGIPEGWSWSVTPRKALVAPGALAEAELALQPPESAQDCTEHPVHVTGWAARSGTLVRLGGATVRVDLRRRAEIETRTRLTECRREDLDKLAAAHKLAIARGEPFVGFDGEGPQCLRTVTLGCTNPKIAHREIIIRYEGPDGVPEYRTVMTDANGCFEDVNVVVEGGDHGVQVTYPGDECLGPATGEVVVAVPLEPVDRPEPTLPDADGRSCVAGLSADVEGEMLEATPVAVDQGMCKAQTLDRRIVLKVADSGAFGAGAQGEIELDLRSIGSPHHDLAGHAAGRFRWKGTDFVAIGTVSGLSGIGSSRIGNAACPTCIEPPAPRGHWELQLRGTVVDGRDAGALIRTSLVLDEDGRSVAGAAEGTIERRCGLSEAGARRRIAAAGRSFADAAPERRSCGGRSDCLSRLSKTGEGEAVLDQRGEDLCRAADCGALKTWQRLSFKLLGDPARGDGGGPSGAAELTVDRFVTIMTPDGSGRGHQGGAFVMTTASGATIRGEMTGISHAGAHHPRGARPLTDPAERGRMVGRLEGEVVSGTDKGVRVEARYVMQVVRSEGRRSRLRIALDGWSAPPCGQRLAETRTVNGSGLVSDAGERIGPSDIGDRLRDLRAAVEPSSSERRSPGAPRFAAGPASSPAADPAAAQPGLKLRVIPRESLPESLVRPITELPADAVRAYVEAEGGSLDASAERRLRLADHRFRAIGGAEGDGLSIEEFAALYAIPSGGADASLSQEEALSAWYLRRYDKNRDDRLSAAEFGRGWERFGDLDEDGDGLLDAAELARVLPRIIEDAFAEADIDSNRRVDFREFALWWRTLP